MGKRARKSRKDGWNPELPPCAQAQADGVPCTELGRVCEECEAALSRSDGLPPVSSKAPRSSSQADGSSRAQSRAEIRSTTSSGEGTMPPAVP
jgi:hypothetical protein